MPRTFFRQEHLGSSRTFNDTESPGTGMESSKTSIEEGLNSIRAQIKRVNWADDSGNWFDDVSTHNSKKRGLNEVNSDLDIVEVKKFMADHLSLIPVTVDQGIKASGTLTLTDQPLEGSEAEGILEFDNNAIGDISATGVLTASGNFVGEDKADGVLTASSNLTGEDFAAGVLTASGNVLEGSYAEETLTFLSNPSPGVKASGLWTVGYNHPTDTDGTVQVGDRTYTWHWSFNSPNRIKTGWNTEGVADWLMNAVNGGSGEGTTYGTGTVPHADVTASKVSTYVVKFEANEYGTAGNEFLCTASDGAQPNSGGITNSDYYMRGGEDPDSVTIDGKTYTFQDTLTNVDGNVHIGATASDTIDNLIAAITLGSGSGTDYAAATTLHSTCTAVAGAGDTMVVSAKSKGTAGNLIEIGNSVANYGTVSTSWGRHLTGGTDSTKADMDMTFDWFTYGQTAQAEIMTSGTDNALWDGDTITIGSITYTFRTTLTQSTPYEVLIMNAFNQAKALDYAIRRDPSHASGEYSTATVEHPDVTSNNRSGNYYYVNVSAKDINSSASIAISSSGPRIAPLNEALTRGQDEASIVIDGKTYQFVMGTPTADGEVAHGGTYGVAKDNLIAAINLGAGSGTAYGAATTLHPTVTATSTGTYKINLEAKSNGTAGNAIVVSTQGGRRQNTQWTDPILFDDAQTLEDGVGADTVTIGSKTYTFQETLTNVDGNVHIGATASDSLDNLVAAIILGSGAGTDYATAMTLHPTISGAAGAGDTLDATAKTAGASGNSIATTVTGDNVSWGAATLENGVTGDTITIGSKTYTMQVTLTDVDGNVKVGASASDTLDNLINAINLGSGSGSTYAASMTLHSTVTAAAGAGDTMDAEAKTAGTSGNSIATTKSGGSISWGNSTLTGGLDGETVTIDAKVYTFQAVLTNVDGNVLEGASASDSLDNLIAAITLGVGAGSVYAAAMTDHPTVTAAAGAGDTMDASAETGGTGGNSIATTDTAASVSWGGGTLSGGQTGDTVTVGSKTYVFEDTLTDVDGNVKIGASASDTIDNLIAAITLGAGAGTAYATSMTANTDVTAATEFGDSMRVTSLLKGPDGNTVSTTESGDNLVWRDSTLVNGTNAGRADGTLTLASNFLGEIAAEGTLTATGNPTEAAAASEKMLITGSWYGTSGILDLKVNTGHSYSMVENDTLTIGGITYRFRRIGNLVQNYDVALYANYDGGSQDDQQTAYNLQAAIHGDTTARPNGFYSSTPANPVVECSTVAGTAANPYIRFTALQFGNNGSLSVAWSTFDSEVWYCVTRATTTSPVLYTDGIAPVQYTIDGYSYTPKRKPQYSSINQYSVLTTAGDIRCDGASTANDRLNLLKAINGTGTSGQDYAASTTSPHPTVEAATVDATNLTISAQTPGSAGNSIAVSSVGAGGGWDGGATNLSGGADGYTVTMDSKTYTFQGTLTDVNGNVKIGANASETLDNLIAAVNLDSGAGTKYATSMTLHSTMSAAAGAGDTMTATAKTAGTVGNTLPTTETGDDLSWGASTLEGGLNGETVTIDSKVYTMTNSLTDSDGRVLVGATANDSIDNLVAAIGLLPGANTLYANAMTIHPTCLAVNGGSDTMSVSAKAGGTAGNSISTTETATTASWANSTLTGGLENETVTMDSKTYTFQSGLTDSDGNVKIGADVEESIENLANAVILGPGTGTAYADSMTEHSTVTASKTSSTTMGAAAKAAGSGGNSIATTETMANGSWGDSTLGGGDPGGYAYGDLTFTDNAEKGYAASGVLTAAANPAGTAPATGILTAAGNPTDAAAASAVLAADYSGSDFVTGTSGTMHLQGYNGNPGTGDSITIAGVTYNFVNGEPTQMYQVRANYTWYSGAHRYGMDAALCNLSRAIQGQSETSIVTPPGMSEPYRWVGPNTPANPLAKEDVVGLPDFRGYPALRMSAVNPSTSNSSLAVTWNCPGGAKFQNYISVTVTDSVAPLNFSAGVDPVQFTIDGKNYRFKLEPGNYSEAPPSLWLTQAGDISAESAIISTTDRTRLINCINGSGSPGTDYATGTVVPHPSVSAAANATADYVDITAKTAGAAGNSIAVSVTRVPAQIAGWVGDVTSLFGGTDDNTVTIGSKTYTFQGELTDVDGNVHIGASASDTLDNLINAINLGSGAGTDYATSMTLHSTVSALAGAGDTLDATAKTPGTGGNSIATTETGDDLSWGASTLEGGVTGDTVTIDSKVYTFQEVLTNVDGNVLVGASASDTLDNLIAAITLGSGSGTKYAAATTQHSSCTAAAGAGDTMDVETNFCGAFGNSIDSTETGANLSWGASTLEGGSDGEKAVGVLDMTGNVSGGVKADGILSASDNVAGEVPATGTLTAAANVSGESKAVGEFSVYDNDLVSGAKASNTLASTSCAPGNTVNIDGITYTFRDPPAQDYDVSCWGGSTTEDKLNSLRNCINAVGGGGYYATTPPHPTCHAPDLAIPGDPATLKVYARTKGAAGNSIEVGDSSSTIWWTGGLTLSGGSDAATITIDSKTYTFQETLTNVDGNVHIGADADETIDNLIAAITLGAGAGTKYAAAMTLHPTVSAGDGTYTYSMIVEAKTAGTAGNSIVTSPANNGVGIVCDTGSTLSGGVTGDTVTVDSKTYTFQDELINVDGNVHAGASASDSLDNLIDAINLGAGAGTDYATDMTLHPTVSAAAGDGDTLDATAKTGGTGGNSIATTETGADLSWGASTLEDGATGDQVTIGAKTYNFQDTLTDVDGNVKVGATALETLSNLLSAINLDAGSGTKYAASMTLHPTVAATAGAGVVAEGILTFTDVPDGEVAAAGVLTASDNVVGSLASSGVLTASANPTGAAAATQQYSITTNDYLSAVPATNEIGCSVNYVDVSVAIDGQTYWIRSSATSPYDIHHGNTANETMQNFKNAINGTGTPGTSTYGVGTVAHPTVKALSIYIQPVSDDPHIPIEYRTAGTVGNNTALYTGGNGMHFHNHSYLYGGYNATTVTIDSKTYTFESSLTNVDGHIRVGTSRSESIDHLIAAINLTGTPGSDYASATTLHPTVTALDHPSIDYKMVASAKVEGTAANSIATTLFNGYGDATTWDGATLVNGVDGDTITVDTKTYTFQAILTNVDGNVLVGASAEDSLDNLIAAITGAAGSGATYAAATTTHTTCTASAGDGDTMDVAAKTAGPAGDSIATTETGANLSFGGATLSGGVTGDTVTVDSKTYTFQETLTNVNGNVLEGASASDSLDNLIAAINLGAGGGSTYAAAMTLHSTVSAAAGDGDTLNATAKTPGTGGNSLATTEVSSTLSWGASTLEGGENGDTVTIDSKVYTWRTTLTDVNGNVKIGADVTESIGNIVAAINLDTGAGTKYASSMTLHSTVSGALNGSTLVATAKSAGVPGNALTTTEDGANHSWGGATLSGGLETMDAEAKTSGTGGNSIATTDTSAGLSWDNGTLTGGLIGDQVTVDAKTYTYQDVLTDTDGNILKGASASDSIDNLVAAMNLGAGGGSTYAASTTLHPTVSSTAGAGDTMDAEAKTPGTSGNSIATTETGADMAWGASTLEDGTDDSVTVVIDTKTYTLKDYLTDTNGYVKIGSSGAETYGNLLAAINLDSGAGTLYAASTTLHPTVSAAAQAADTLRATAKTGGVSGNSIATTETSKYAAWGASTLEGGIDVSNFVILSLAAGEIPSLAAAVDTVTTEGLIVAYNSNFAEHSMAAVAGQNALTPKNLCTVRDVSSGERLLSDGKIIYALLQSEDITNGHAFNDNDKRVMLSFVRENATGDALEECPAADIDGEEVYFNYSERAEFNGLDEAVFLNDYYETIPALATDVTLDNAIDGQVGAVSQAQDIDVDIANTKEWVLRDANSVDLLKIRGDAGGSTSEIEIGSAVDIYDNNAVDVDFEKGIAVGSAGIEISINETGGVISRAADLILRASGSGELHLYDSNKPAGWSLPNGIKLSENSTEWTDFETVFGGEVSILNAVKQAATISNRVIGNAVLQVDAAEDVDVDATTTSRLDVDLPDYSSVVSFLTDVDIFVNGVLMINGADAGASGDVYPGSTPSQGMLKFNFSLTGTGTPDTITMVVWGV